MKSILIWTGGIALLAVALIDTLAVIGRNSGFTVRGSIELIQPVILTGGSIAILIATIADTHARVRLVFDRLNPGTKSLADRGSELAMIGFFTCVLIGSVWIAVDLWSLHEQSEIVEMPWRWMRLVANMLLSASIAVSIWRLIRGLDQT